MDRANAIQEKNRRAQKRFRERQKVKMTTMEEQLEQSHLELARLRAENTELLSRNSILEKVLALRDDQLSVLQEGKQVLDVDGWPAMVAAAPPYSECVMGMKKEDVVSTQAAPHAQVIAAWKDAVRTLANLLVELQSTECKETLSRLDHVAKQAGELCMRTAILNPVNIKKLLVCNMEEKQLYGQDQQGQVHWAAVLNALQLTGEQRLEILRLRHDYLLRLAAIMQTRRQITGKVQMSIPDTLTNNRGLSMMSLQTNDAMMAMKDNMRDEHIAGMDFIATMFKRVFTSFQLAVAAVQSYPLYPDALAIANAIAVQEGQVEVLHLPGDLPPEQLLF
jgi:hypothetical protein